MLLRLTIAATIAFCAVTMATVRADAQSSSARAITLVVPFPAGGPTDTIGRIVMARGRDAADVAFSTTFGPNVLKRFVVHTDEVAAAEMELVERKVA